MVSVAALSTISATIFTGARVYHALGHDVPQLALLGASNDRGETPARALVLQGGIALGLVVFGAMTENGTAAVVTGLIVLRQRDPERVRPFRVPLYSLTSLLFAAACLGLLWSSTTYAGPGAIVGLIVLAAGLPLLLLHSKDAMTMSR